MISGQEQRFHKWFVMALSQIKTNTQKQETRDEPQTNGSYKIRQTMSKIMESTHTHTHTHIYIHTHEQSQNSPTKIKCSRLAKQTKEIKNYIYLLRTELTSTNWKTKLKQDAK